MKKSAKIDSTCEAIAAKDIQQDAVKNAVKTKSNPLNISNEQIIAREMYAAIR